MRPAAQTRGLKAQSCKAGHYSPTVHQRCWQPTVCHGVQHTQEQQQQMLHKHQLSSLSLLGAVASMMLCSGAATAATAEASFQVKCAGCHINGGNIVQAGATLFNADLVKNNVADSDSLYKLIYSGKGRMPGFGQDCAPKGKCTFGPRLSDDEVKEMTQYVLDQAAQDWKQ